MGVRIAITGANSAIGRSILGLPPADPPHDVSFVACVRSERAERQLPPLPGAESRVARIAYDDPETLLAALAGCAAAIHLPGVLVERPGSSYETANLETTRAVLNAAQKCGVGRFVLVSAVGACARSPNRYYRTKGEAEALVRSSELEHAILRAPLVLGPGTEGAAALSRHARGRRAFLLGGGRNLEQPIDVADVARAALRAATGEAARNRTLDLAGSEALPNRELVARAARALGREVRIIAVPLGLARLAARVRTRLLGPGFSPDAIDVVTTDTELPAEAARELGIELTSLDEMIRRSVTRTEGT